MKKIYDITPAISPKLNVWPGDTPFSYDILMDQQKGDTVTLSRIQSTVHLGAHADAPKHYGIGGESIDERDLHYYLGKCQVVKVNVTRNSRIKPEDLGGKALEAERVLFVTDTFDSPYQWNSDFAALSPELLDYLHERGVILVGIDTPSADLEDSKDLPAHQRLFIHNMAILEGLALAGVPEGTYELIALPLKLAGLDGSPVRAVLREL